MIPSDFQIIEKVAGFSPFKSKIKPLTAKGKALDLLRRNRSRADENNLVAGFGGVVAVVQVTLTDIVITWGIAGGVGFKTLVA